MFFNAITFKDSATPFAEALVELHHEIMFYLVVIVSVVIFILANAINVTRVRESYFYSNFFSFTAFFKSLFLNSVFMPLFSKFLYSPYYLKIYAWFIEVLTKTVYVVASSGSAYLTYFLKSILFVKGFLLKVSSIFSSVEATLARLFGDYKSLNNENLLPNSYVSNMFFYKTRNLSSYLSYLSNIISYLSVLSLFADIDYKSFTSNRSLLYSYFVTLSHSASSGMSSRLIASSLDMKSLEGVYFHNEIPNVNEINSHFFSFFVNFMRNRFSSNKRLSITSSKLTFVEPLNINSVYSFINAQTYTVHNTKLEVIWTVIPTIVLIFIAIPSFILLYSLDEVINPSITLKAIGHQWYWSYEYSDYTEENSINFDSYMINEGDLQFGQFRLLEVDNRVVLPVNTHIRVLITAGDVLHSWAVPSMNVKADAVPGRLNQLTLFIKRPGVYYGQCSELCGVNHAFMPIVIEAVSLWNYSNWLSTRFSEAGVDFELSN